MTTTYPCSLSASLCSKRNTIFLAQNQVIFAAPAFSVGINIFSSSFKAMHQEGKKFVVVNSDDGEKVMRVLRKTKTIRMLK